MPFKRTNVGMGFYPFPTLNNIRKVQQHISSVVVITNFSANNLVISRKSPITFQRNLSFVAVLTSLISSNCLTPFWVNLKFVWAGAPLRSIEWLDNWRTRWPRCRSIPCKSWESGMWFGMQIEQSNTYLRRMGVYNIIYHNHFLVHVQWK